MAGLNDEIQEKLLIDQVATYDNAYRRACIMKHNSREKRRHVMIMEVYMRISTKGLVRLVHLKESIKKQK